MARLLTIGFLFLALATLALAMFREKVVPTTAHPNARNFRPPRHYRHFSVYYSDDSTHGGPLELICSEGHYSSYPDEVIVYGLNEQSSNLQVIIKHNFPMQRSLKKANNVRKAGPIKHVNSNIIPKNSGPGR